ncbi:Homeodomain superfamily protein [Salix suchowensis]|nr:Homeodomain superfamily protein [Salix suchowensis]
MAVAFTNLSWWLWSGKHQEPRISNGPSLNARPDPDLWESSDTLKFPLVQRTNVASSSRRVKRKWHSREERKIDREYDVVLVPSDGGCVSGSESDDSDYSIGWLEPHGPEFQSDDDMDNSFAVLVPCYGRVQDNVFEDKKNSLFGAIVNIPDESKKYMEQWLSSVQNI